MGLLSGRLTHDLDRRRTRVNATGRFAGLVELARLPAVVARCRGLLADDPTEAGVLFAEATRLQTLLPLPFELARTRLCAGGDPAQIAASRCGPSAPARSNGRTFDDLVGRPR